MLKGRVAAVTGGSRGIGRAICLMLASRGADIVVNYAGNEAAAQAVVKECEALGSRAIAVRADVSDFAACERLIKTVVEEFGRIDILVNNAGVTKDNLMMRMSEAEFDQVINTNLKGTFACIKYASRVMMKQRYGRIINISSIVGVVGNAGQANYAASKAGIIGLTKSAAKELASRNITVNAVAPGFIETDMTAVLSDKIVESLKANIAVGRLGSADDVANAVLFFSLEQSGYVTGQVLGVDGMMG